MSQLLLCYPAHPGHKAPGPSAAAAHRMAGKAERLRDRVLALLAKEHLTADEAAAALGEDVLSVRPRFSELLARGKIIETGVRRPSSRGTPSSVWRAV